MPYWKTRDKNTSTDKVIHQIKTIIDKAGGIVVQDKYTAPHVIQKMLRYGRHEIWQGDINNLRWTVSFRPHEIIWKGQSVKLMPHHETTTIRQIDSYQMNEVSILADGSLGSGFIINSGSNITFRVPYIGRSVIFRVGLDFQNADVIRAISHITSAIKADCERHFNDIKPIEIIKF
jgi:hypothetical protein